MLIKKIGQGSYGTVVRARHIPTGNMVAIKKIQNVFAKVCDAKRLLREILILKSIGFHQNIVKLLDVIEPTNRPHIYNTLFLVFEAQRSDLLWTMI